MFSLKQHIMLLVKSYTRTDDEYDCTIVYKKARYVCGIFYWSAGAGVGTQKCRGDTFIHQDLRILSGHLELMNLFTIRTTEESINIPARPVTARSASVTVGHTTEDRP